MIDIRKALSQRCYIVFDTNEQLVKFVAEHKLSVFMCILKDETILSVYENGEYSTVSLSLKEITHYHHSQLTITDDGE